MKHALLLALLACAPAWAALPPMSPATRMAQADLVVTAAVGPIETHSVNSRVGTDWESTATVTVDTVEKGSARVGQVLQVHYHRTHTRPAGWVGPVGQNEPLVTGTPCRLFLTGHRSLIELLQPNGWEPVSK